ncbi:tRNA (cytosine(72)-C(5))-methyltransferase NSUN6 [Halotydeus destructor]|nr:tRNA (cytosine(72)-C(5))-methyltransferase NSUN6 [Halotydeus destructor]
MVLTEAYAIFRKSPLSILYRQGRKKLAKFVHLLKYKYNLVPRMPTYTGDQIELFYPRTPYYKNEQFSNDLYNEMKMQLNHEEFMQLESWLTRPPRYTTVRLNTSLISAENAVEEITEIHEDKCHRKQCKFPNIYVHPKLNDLVIIEPSTELQQVYPNGKEVIVDLLCGQAILRGAELYCGGILAAPLDLRYGDVVAVFCDVEEKCLQGWSKPYNGKKVFVGNGVSHVSRRDLFCSEPKTGLGVQILENVYPTPSLYAQFGSTLYLQNLPSTVCVHVLNPQPGDVVLDICAAPGGKTTHIATLMKSKGTVVAMDRSPQRTANLKQNVLRWGLADIIKVHQFNALKSVNDDQVLADEDKIQSPPYKKETFDKILVDAPCSALGNRPQLCRPFSLKDLHSYPAQQRPILSKAVQLCKVGGTLVYSTCSVSISENECVVDYILNKYPGSLELVAQEPHLGGIGWKGNHTLTDKQLSLLQRFANFKETSVNCDTIGFFIAKFKKIASV